MIPPRRRDYDPDDPRPPRGFVATLQWHLHQGRRGLLPTFNELAAAAALRGLFSNFRSFDDWWEGVKNGFLPEFVEWVEEQRSKLA